MNIAPINSAPIDGLSRLVPAKAPDPQRSTSARVGPDPQRSTSVRLDPQPWWRNH